VAFVTSPSGAAIHDFLEVARRRWHGVQVLVIPAKVQGAGAAADLVRGIATANRLVPAPDVLVVGRGGGSMEDLWCFNEEPVVRAIHASRIPVVSAVGHEIDVTLADLVADVRALTPSEAAERVVPSADELQAGLDSLRRRLAVGLRSRLTTARGRLESLAQHRVFRRPFDRVQELSRYLDDCETRSTRAIRQRLRRGREQLVSLASRLESLSPLAVLQRGYSVTQRASDGQLVREATMLGVGDQIVSRFAQGQATSRIEQIQ
jgi:exodeoxyribonuclease VII large subunit